MSFPVYLTLGSLRIHPHWVFESLGYIFGFRLYLRQRRLFGDSLSDGLRWWIIAAAAVGAVVGSKVLYWFEDPALTLAQWHKLAYLMGGKTIVGALIGGLFAVESMKWRLGIRRRTGDLFALPLCIGIGIGRIGCFLSGTQDHTAGMATALPWGVNFGDGIARHPAQLYEVVFALALGTFLWRRMQQPYPEGDIFKMFMVAYFAFRLAGDFLKPEVHIFVGMSSLQWASAAMLVYCGIDIARWSRKAARKPEEQAIEKLNQACREMNDHQSTKGVA
jgi:prolipoprotein diacylglyceryltransferase